MPLSELTELVARIDGADLRSLQGRSAIAQRIGQLQAMLDRIGARNSAARLGVAARLVQRIGDGASSADEDAQRMVHTLVVAVEQSFHLQPIPPAAGTPEDEAPARGAPQKKSRAPRQAKSSRAAELAVVRDMLLGEVLIHFDVLTPEVICAALELQRDTGQCLGDLLVEHGFTTQDEIDRALGYQNTIRGMITGESKTRTPDPAAEQPHAPLSAVNRSVGRLRLATELLMGEVLVLNGTITRKALERALAMQRSSGMLIGESLIQTGAATRADIQRALVSQGRGDRIGRKARSSRAA